MELEKIMNHNTTIKYCYVNRPKVMSKEYENEFTAVKNMNMNLQPLRI
jgi:hypothetical protein